MASPLLPRLATAAMAHAPRRPSPSPQPPACPEGGQGRPLAPGLPTVAEPRRAGHARQPGRGQHQPTAIRVGPELEAPPPRLAVERPVRAEVALGVDGLPEVVRPRRVLRLIGLLALVSGLRRVPIAEPRRGPLD